VLAFTVQRRRLVAVEKKIPHPPNGWALIRVLLAGICNTDIEILRGYHSFRGTPGHEFIGEVADVKGASARTRAHWLGRRVVGEINISCSSLGIRPLCAFCWRGLRNHCAHRKVLGILSHDGAFAEYLTLPLENLHRVPDSIPDANAVFAEPLAAACEILTQVPVRRFARAAVLGDGKLAQLIALVLHTAGLHVIVFGKHKGKLALARRAGIETHPARKLPLRDRRRKFESFPLVVEATGSPSGLAAALQLTEPRGTLILKSTFHGSARFETWPMVVNELNIIGSRCGPFPAALALLRNKKVDPGPLISRTFRLAEAPDAIRYAQQPGVMKVLLEP
jgi:threonine dehydrogenase-like Zn-dependent dehydrogenase